MNIIKSFYLTFLLLVTSNLFSQTKLSYNNKIYKDNIKTVLFHRMGERFSYPILDLNKNDKLLLEFDDLKESKTDYTYTIIHCNYDWTPSDISFIEYIDGFEESIIDDYENSFNTLVEYRHYKLEFPNVDVKPLLTGNYVVYVYEDYDKDKPVLSRRFNVVENKVDIQAKVKRSSKINDINDSQEIVFSVLDINKIIFNPLDDMKITILQNNIQNINIGNVKPDFIKGDVYEFINSDILKFKGGNEYRYFNTKTYKNINDRISSIKYKEPYYFFNLVTEKSEARFPYTYAQDINGEMLITAENVYNSELESEYVYVDFNLKYFNNLKETDFYVFGALTDFEINDKYKMYYDFGEKKYKLRMLVKQGFYNYQYVSLSADNKVVDFSLIEGNHYETENDYVIYVYYRRQGRQYDELLGYKIINSIKEL